MPPKRKAPVAKTKNEEPASKKGKGDKGKTSESEPAASTSKSNTTSSSDKKWNMKFTSWNVNGVRAWIEKKGSRSFLIDDNADVFCLQETKCSAKNIPSEMKSIDGYKSFWYAAEKEGYAGTALFSKKDPIKVSYGIGIEKHDKEGRVITAEFDNFFFVTAYIPNSGRGLPRLAYRTKEWDQDFLKYLKNLDAKKPVIFCGDLNVAHKEIDLANPKTNAKTAGFTNEEREEFTKLLNEGFCDSFRHLYPDKTGAYSWWSYFANARGKNVGWRLDYFVISDRLKDKLADSVIRSEVHGSDHCPISLLMQF